MICQLNDDSANSKKRFVKKKRLLIVEDIEDIREAYRMTFENEFQIEEAAFSKDAIRLFDSFSPHVVLLDGHLNEYDNLQGIQLLGLFKSKRPDVIVCVISADPTLKYAMLTKGADAFFDKPFEHDKVHKFLLSKGLIHRSD